MNVATLQVVNSLTRVFAHLGCVPFLAGAKLSLWRQNVCEPFAPNFGCIKQFITTTYEELANTLEEDVFRFGFLTTILAFLYVSSVWHLFIFQIVTMPAQLHYRCPWSLSTDVISHRGTTRKNSLICPAAGWESCTPINRHGEPYNFPKTAPSCGRFSVMHSS